LVVFAGQGEAIARLESELGAERDAHEGTLKDAEAALLELETFRGQQGAHAPEEALQTRLAAEASARQEAEVSLYICNTT